MTTHFKIKVGFAALLVFAACGGYGLAHAQLAPSTIGPSTIIATTNGSSSITTTITTNGMVGTGATTYSVTNGTTGYTTTGTTTTPGFPNTGAGGSAASNDLILGLSGIAVIAGITYISRKLAQ